jgi:hypothetical protein
MLSVIITTQMSRPGPKSADDNSYQRRQKPARKSQSGGLPITTLLGGGMPAPTPVYIEILLRPGAMLMV